MSDKILFCTCAKMIFFTTSELKLYLNTSAINYTPENYYVKLISLNFPGGGEGGPFDPCNHPLDPHMGWFKISYVFLTFLTISIFNLKGKLVS